MKTGRLVKTLAAAALVAAIACTAVSGQAAQVRGTVAASTVLQEVSKQEQINGINTGYVYSTAGTLPWGVAAQGDGKDLFVNRLTGNVAYQFTVGNLSFVYNSSQEANYGFGNGITCAQAPRMEKLSDSVYKNVRDDGSATYYINGSCDYSGASSASLKTYPDGSSELTLGVHQKTITRFDANGRANSQSNYPFGQTNPTMTFFYYYEESGYLGEIYSQGKADDLYYVQDANGQYRLDSVVSNGKTYSFTFDGDGNLTRVTGGDDMISFGYQEGTSLLTSVSSSRTGRSVQAGYVEMGGRNRASSVLYTDAAGAVLDRVQLAYGNNQTIVVNNDGSTTILNFDENGYPVQ